MSKSNKIYCTKMVETDKFRMKCQKKFKFLKDERYEKNNFDVLCNIVDELITVISNNKLDVETFNRIKSHPERLIYHANNILRISHNIEFKRNRQKLNELKTAILYHDISKCINFDKYNGERKKDHAMFSAIILETVMKYLEFEQDVIDRITKNIIHHTDKRPGNPNNLDYAGLLLIDVDIMDEQDVYGVLLYMALRGFDKKVIRNNFMNQKDIELCIVDFINDVNAFDKLILEESIEYYHTIMEKIELILTIIRFENEEVFI
jgi:hypothetical protein